MKTAIFAGLGLAASLMAQQAQQAPQKGPSVKSKEEGAAVVAVMNAQSDPDATIKAAEDLLAKYKDTEFKDMAFFMEAQAYQKKGDADRAQIYAEKAVDANPKNFQASLLLGEGTAQRIRENDLNKDEELAKAEKYLNQTIDILKTAEKPNPQLPDAQWEQIKKQLIAEAQSGLGVCALDRKKYDDAITDFKAASDGDPEEPTYFVRLASAYQQAHKYDEAIAACDKVMGMANVLPQVKNAATSIKAESVKAKGGGKL